MPRFSRLIFFKFQSRKYQGMFLVLLDPDPLVRGTGSISQRYGSGSFYHQAIIVMRKTLIPTFCDFFLTFYLIKIMLLYPYLQKVKSGKTQKKGHRLGSGSVPTCHGSETLVHIYMTLCILCVKKRLWRAYISFIDWSDPGDRSEEIRQSFAQVCQEEKQLQQGNLSPHSCNKMLRILRKMSGRF